MTDSPLTDRWRHRVRQDSLSLLLAVFCATCSDGGSETETSTPRQDPLRAEEGRLFDEHGREVLLRGVNARVEGLFDVTFDDGRTPLEDIPHFGEPDCAFLQRQGFNFLRLPVNWSGIEPERGTYDDDYIDRVLGVADACEPYGVRVLVDLHQDAYSKHIGEDGAPLWAIVPPPAELLQGPLEDLAARRLSNQVLKAFSSFFDNADDLQGAYADMAAHLASRIHEHPNIVGLELMNEPMLGSAPSESLGAFHEAVGRRVREVAPELTLFFEPDSIRNMTDTAPVERPFPLQDAVYAPHIYTGVFLFEWEPGDEARLRESVELARSEADAHQTALLIGEFGNDPAKEAGVAWLASELALFDEHRVSWAMWVYEEDSQDRWGFYDTAPDGSRHLRPDVVELFARPYPQAVDGRLRAMRWDAVGGILEVEIDNAGVLEHLIAIPEAAFPNPPSVLCDGAPVDWIAAPGSLSVKCSGTTIRVQRP